MSPLAFGRPCHEGWQAPFPRRGRPAHFPERARARGRAQATFLIAPAPPRAVQPAAAYFTVKSANEALPDVAKKYDRAVSCRDGVVRAEKRLQAAVMGGSGMAALAESKRALNSALTQFYHSIEQLENTGAVVKSLDDGLLDFPSKRFDEEIWLCWKAGEGEIKFWHDADSGFGGRKPLEVSDESLV